MSLSAHLQTISSMVPTRRRPALAVQDERIEIPIPEGGELVVECVWQPQRAPAVIVMHGVAGNSQDPYVLRAADAFVSAGFHAVRLNQRGSGLGRRRAQRIYHAALTEDLALVDQMLAQRDDVASSAILGFSLGGHTALCYAGEPRSHRMLAAVATISAPVDLPFTMQHLDNTRGGLMGIYQTLMVKNILRGARDLVDRRGLNGSDAPVTHHHLDRINTLLDVDRHLTVPLHGFTDLATYHHTASAAHRMRTIDVPTLLIHAEDDPVIPVSQTRTMAGSAHVEALVVQRGGHIGFHESLSQLWGESFAITRAIEHFRKHL